MTSEVIPLPLGNNKLYLEIKRYRRHMFCSMSKMLHNTTPYPLPAVSLHEHVCYKNVRKKIANDVQLQSQKGSSPALLLISESVKWFRVFFSNPSQLQYLTRPNICVFTQPKLSFRAQVWRKLADTVQAGEVVTYGDLAKRLNNPENSPSVRPTISPSGFISPSRSTWIIGLRL
ncbi:unnamed protein product, partial [Meganyctiphanes norvegica]